MPEIASRRRGRFPAALGVCLASCGLTAAILAVIYALRGVWPFGTDNIAYIDTAQFFIPDYYALWDAMHGAKAVGLNWFSGLAESGSASWASLLQNDILWPCFLNPANWVFLFVARDQILEGLSLYLAVYMMLTALSACIVLRRRFARIGGLMQIVLSLLYAFSGYVLQYYFSLGWFLILILFPPLLLGLESLLREGRYILYTVTYTILVCLNVYFTYMVTVYIVLFSFFYCVLLLPREQRGARLLRLGLGTIFAFGAGAYFWTKNLASFTGTSRFDSNLSSGLIEGFSTWNIPYTACTTLMLLGSAFMLALLIRALRRARPGSDGRRPLLFFLCVLGALVVPMIFTNIDTAWHFGQYNFFPMRYGFTLTATLIAAAAHILETQADEAAPPAASKKRSLLRIVGIVSAAAALVTLVPILEGLLHEYNTSFLPSMGRREYWLQYFTVFVGCGLLFTSLYLLLLRLRSRRLSAWLIAAAVVLQLGANAYGLIAPNDDRTYAHEFDPAYIDMANDVYAHYAGQTLSPLSRFKNADVSLNAGYPALAGVGALSSVNSLNSSERLAAFRALGYSTHYFRILDAGGTVFSDMLLGVDRVLTLAPADETLYTDRGETAGALHIAEAKYPGVVGLMFENGALDGCLEEPAMAERLNAIYAAFTGSDRELAFTPELSLASEGDGFADCTLSCALDDDVFLYISTEKILTGIAVDGRTVYVPTYRNGENLVYPAPFNSNLLYLGRFGPGTAEITFRSAALSGADELSVTAVRADLLDTFRADAFYDPGVTIETDADSAVFTLTAEREGMSLFLPMTYSDRWHVSVNGEPADTAVVLDTLMSVPLRAGENVVSMTYESGLFRPSPSMAVSALFLVLAAVWLVLRRRPAVRSFELPPAAGRAVWWLFLAVFAAIVLFIYAAPTALLLLRGRIEPI